MKKVLIIMSTFNGEKYITEQIQSLLTQTYPISILVRDDGSRDRTLELLEKYELENENLRVIKGENIGVVKSFNTLIAHRLVDNYDFIAFCDQDDVWDQDKIQTAVRKIMKFDQSLPLMYCSNLRVVDKDLNFIRNMRKTPQFTRKSALVQNIATGCTEVFNKEAVKLYRRTIGKYSEIHDYMMYLVCVHLGKVVYDDEPHISYRQHGNNVIGVTDSSIGVALSNIQNYGKRQRTLMSFLSSFSDRLNVSDKKNIQRIINYDKSVADKLILLIDPSFRGNTAKVTIGFKIRILFNRLY